MNRVAAETYMSDGWQCMKYHRTVVAKFKRCFGGGKTVQLNTGGWFTYTTKRRMNQFARDHELDFCVYQKDFDWYVSVNGDERPFDSTGIDFVVLG